VMRAIIVMPHRLIVAARKDASSAVLVSATSQHRSDPAGLIACPLPRNVRDATAYSFLRNPITNYAGSSEFDDGNFNVILQYQFENQIISALGYGMKWR
jgi:hypothetical protein